jgi:excinuclease UvrABC nuclease subunit
MKKYRFIKPYTDDGKTNLRETIEKIGVYLIHKKGDVKPVYIGMSGSNLYKTILRHFQSWEDKQTRVVYPKQGYLVRVVTCTPLQAAKLERALIVRHKPKDNPNKYENYTLDLTDKKAIQVYEEKEVAPF